MNLAGSGDHVLIGRASERQVIGAAIADIHERAGVFALFGEPGVGKSALLDHVAWAAGSIPVTRARGVQSETLLPFATLADVLRPLYGYLPGLTTIQRRALEVSLALAEGAEENPYAVCAATLNLLALAAEKQPLVALIDDLQWADPSSYRVLLFVARRLLSEAIVLVFAAHSATGRTIAAEGVHALEIRGLSRGECFELLRARSLEAAPDVREQLFRWSSGNPLALIETASGLSAEQRAGRQPISGGPPVGTRLEWVWTRQVRDLPEPAQLALVTIAASRSGSPTAIGLALRERGLGIDALAPAELAGLVRQTPGGYEFRHPVLRSIILHSCTSAQRIQAFQSLAETASEPLSSWYRAALLTEPDETVAAALAAVATDAHRRSAFDAAALAWRRAAEITPDQEIRSDRLREAAAGGFLTGATAEAALCCEEALRLTSDPVRRADIELVRGRIRAFGGRPWEAEEQLVAAAQAVDPHDPARAGVLLSEAVLPAVMVGRVREALGYAETCRAQTSTLQSAVLHACMLVLVGRVTDGMKLLEESAKGLEQADPVLDQQTLTYAGQALSWSERDQWAHQILTTVIDAAHRQGAPAALSLALAARSEVDWWAGWWKAAYADAMDSLRWTEELRHVSGVSFCTGYLARIDAARGNRARCDERLAGLRRTGVTLGSLDGWLAGIRGMAAFAGGDYGGAIEHLEYSADRAQEIGFNNPIIHPGLGDLAEAHIRLGNSDRADRAVRRLEDQAAITGLSWPIAAAARCRGLMCTDLVDAEQFFAQAETALQRRKMPFEQARVRLSRGEVLRRNQRGAEARAPLGEALTLFQALGAAPWAERAAAELAATGQRRAPVPAPRGLDLLTPQELQVARVIARGMNNSETASVLFLSRKTVEAHLTRIYRKMEIRSRTDLTRAVIQSELSD